uniref:Lipocalin/cytosolic fatty-acid binding domain-containing protein n=1 Tax=Seriola dumerili TaxID=41447 RepID=A0A3B4T246_SERDU
RFLQLNIHPNMFAVFATVLCLVSVSHSAPLACENLVRPSEQLDPLHLEGRWTLVAGSLNDSADAAALKGRDSVTIDFNNSTYTQVNRVGDKCDYDLLDITFEGHIMSLQTRNYNFTGTFFQTSCPDCAVLSLDVKNESFYKTLNVLNASQPSCCLGKLTLKQYKHTFILLVTFQIKSSQKIEPVVPNLFDL